MNITEKKEFCRQFIETVFGEGKVDAIEKFAAPKHRFNDLTTGFNEPGTAALTKYVLNLRKAFPDLKFKFEDQIAEGDKIVSFLTVMGTHEAEFVGIAASHKKLNVPMFVIQKFEGDKIAEATGLWDAMTFLRTVGALEAREPALAAR